MSEVAMDSFYMEVPKIELHAHLSGSVSQTTLLKILDESQSKTATQLTIIEKGDQRSLEECFEIFTILHEVFTSSDIVERVTVDVIEEFAADGVIYLELRTTIRRLPSHRDYLDAVLRGLTKAPSTVDGKITPRLLLSIDRSREPNEAWVMVDLLKAYSQSEFIVGIELSGNPAVGTLLDFVEPLNAVQSLGFKTSVHLAELPNEGEQWLEFLKRHIPNRIGHGTYLPTPDTPSDGTAAFIARDRILALRIPIEICLTSNVKCKTVPTYESHHLPYWIQAGHPVCICTDDKGIFCCSASSELAAAVERCGLPKMHIRQILNDSVKAAFCSSAMKADLLRQLDTFFNAQIV